MKNVRKIFIIFLLGVLYTSAFGPVFAQEKRESPFLPQFPIVEVIKEAFDRQRIVVIESEKVFNVSAYKLQGVVWGAYEPKAIINNKIHSIGDLLGEAEIKKINKEGVTVLFHNKEYIIRTKNPFIERNQEEVTNEYFKE